MTHTAFDPDELGFSGTVSIGVAGQFIEANPAVNVFQTSTVCLGPRAYGGPVDFEVGTLANPSCNNIGPGMTDSTVTVAVDQVIVRPASDAECPPPGAIVNGDFEGVTGWQFTTSGGATGAIVAGAGENGTRGVQFVAPTGCAVASATGTIALPGPEVAHQAIDVFWKGPIGSQLQVLLAGHKAAILAAAGSTGQHAHVCVPAWARGTTTTIGFAIDPTSGSNCPAGSRTFAVDNITIVSDPVCSAPGDITDPGFERVANLNGPASGWGVTSAFVNALQGATALIVNDPQSAHTGNGYLYLSHSNPCAGEEDAGADVTVLVPPSQPGAGAALAWFSSVAATNTHATARVELRGTAIAFDLARTGQWEKHVLCLPAGLANRRVTAHFGMAGPGGTCSAAYPPETALFDDVSIGTDASCPP